MELRHVLSRSCRNSHSHIQTRNRNYFFCWIYIQSKQRHFLIWFFRFTALSCPGAQLYNTPQSKLAAIFAPVPCSASINKSSAYHFGPVSVGILLQHYRVMAAAQAPVEAAFPAAQALVQVPPVAAANVENPSAKSGSFAVIIFC